MKEIIFPSELTNSNALKITFISALYYLDRVIFLQKPLWGIYKDRNIPIRIAGQCYLLQSRKADYSEIFILFVFVLLDS